MDERFFKQDRSWLARLRSFGDALRGLTVLLVTQPNARVHAALTVVAVAFGWWLALSKTEWLFLVGAIGLVWVAEGFNTAIEFLVDLVSQCHGAPRIDRHEEVHRTKNFQVLFSGSIREDHFPVRFDRRCEPFKSHSRQTVVGASRPADEVVVRLFAWINRRCKREDR